MAQDGCRHRMPGSAAFQYMLCSAKPLIKDMEEILTRFYQKNQYHLPCNAIEKKASTLWRNEAVPISTNN